ncbi:hypothetical protein [Streptomyces sp. NPDC049040]|uniref:hypothetical protein n=1 Tax=Streptomyces sp. NPDC049040 TaxID=3365593 RepID=UPI0037205C46
MATALAAALTAAPTGGSAAAAPAGHRPAVKPVPTAAGHRLIRGVSSPLSIAQCQATWGIDCYGPLQYRQAYAPDPLHRAGVTGKGRTIVVVDSFGSPTIQHDLDVYSAHWGIKSSTVQVVEWGDVPPFDPADPDHGVRDIVGARRGTPDISMAAAVDGGAWVYSSYDPAATGWDVYGGTSEAAPLFAGVIAPADQLGGCRVGDIHKALYPPARGDARSTGVVDVEDGTDNTCDGVPGHTAVKCYDMATGVGTPDASRFVPALAAAGRGR